MLGIKDLKPLSIDAFMLFKVSSLALLAMYFLFEIEMWRIIFSNQIFYKKAIALLFFCSLYFGIYNIKEKIKFNSLILTLCFFDIFFIAIYFFYSSIPINLFVGLLSVNILIAGFNLSLVNLGVITSMSIFILTIFLNFKDLLEIKYGFMYIFLNSLSFIIYGGASYFLQTFFKKNKGEMTILTKHLFKERELNKAVLSSLKTSVFITEREGTPQPLNDAARKILDNDMIKMLKPFSDYPLNKEGSVKEIKVNERFYKVYGSGLKSGSNTQHVKQNVLLVSDETSSKKAQKELEEARKLSAIGTLSAGLAHEIRNPLAGISGSIQLLKEGFANAKDSKKLFNTVLREIDRLNLLIVDFLSFAHPEIYLIDKIEISNFLKDIVLLLKQDIRSKDVQIKVNCQTFKLVVDQHKLRQVLINLIINSFQAFSQEQKTLLESKGEACKVTILGEKLDSGYSLKVKDNGKGIKKSELNIIFEPFHTTKDKGTGLGLALTHRILDKHGASILVESELEKGTVFTILFK